MDTIDFGIIFCYDNQKDILTGHEISILEINVKSASVPSYLPSKA